MTDKRLMLVRGIAKFRLGKMRGDENSRRKRVTRARVRRELAGHRFP